MITARAWIASTNQNRLSRRAVLRLLGLGAAGGVLLAGCGRDERGGVSGDFSARFATYEAADEPNGDLTKVVWPPFITRAGPEVKRLYEFQIQNGELMRYMPCFCGCGSDGHRNNRDCYVKAINPDGSVVFDAIWAANRLIPPGLVINPDGSVVFDAMAPT